MSIMERRLVTFDIAEMRADNDSDSLSFVGHAAVFNQPTLIGSRSWGFVEWIEPGAFANVLEDDVRFLFNHDGLPLARTSNGTLRLSEDETGLKAEADLADIPLSRDLATLIRRKDITQMSFAFSMSNGGEQRTGTMPDDDKDYAGIPFRAITKVGNLYDVSPVTYPAYDGTDAAMRALDVVKDEIVAVRDTILRDTADGGNLVDEAVRLIRERRLEAASRVAKVLKFKYNNPVTLKEG